MGVGKTTVGKYLSENLTYDFIDVDDNKHWAKHGFSEKEHDDIFWYYNGQKELECKFDFGNLVGSAKIYHDNGILKERVSF